MRNFTLPHVEPPQHLFKSIYCEGLVLDFHFVRPLLDHLADGLRKQHRTEFLAPRRKDALVGSERLSVHLDFDVGV